MFANLKNRLYFPIAWYFRFFAGIRLRRWQPRVIVVTGSSGKTTLLHLLESQFGKKAKVSHHANSSYGIPFDILDLHRKTLRTSEWISLFLKAPFNAYKDPFRETFYIVEADTDRPGEGKFLAELLQPEVVLWVSVSATHGMNFDKLVRHPEFSSGSNKEDEILKHVHFVQCENLLCRQVQHDKQEGGFNTVEEAIAHDFGYFLEYCSKLAVIDGDSPLQVGQVNRTKAEVEQIKKKEYLDLYKVERYGTQFQIKKKKYLFHALLPREVFYSIAMCQKVMEYFDLPFDRSFAEFALPEGRGSLFTGIKNTILIDSTYNANLSSMEAMLGMFAKFQAEKKWVVLGDMLELGEKEQEEHEKLAKVLEKMNLERVILVGKRVCNYIVPILQSATDSMEIKGFVNQKEALAFIQNTILGGEAILFKGSQSIYLEGIIEVLLENKEDAHKLPRRGIFWMNKRREVGL